MLALSQELLQVLGRAGMEEQQNIGDAVTRRLDVLEKTSVNDSSSELRGFCSTCFDDDDELDHEPDVDDDSDSGKSDTTSETGVGCAPIPVVCCENWIVTLFKSEKTWIELIIDSETSRCIAIVSAAYLEFDHDGYGKICSRPQIANYGNESQGYPVLQTSLHLNRSLSPSANHVNLYGEFKAGTKFSIGDHGTLKVLTCARRTCPMISEWRCNTIYTGKEIEDMLVNERIIGPSRELDYREYICDKWKEKPVSVLVLSKSNKISR